MHGCHSLEIQEVFSCRQRFSAVLPPNLLLCVHLYRHIGSSLLLLNAIFVSRFDLALKNPLPARNNKNGNGHS